MKTYTKEELKVILDEHEKWLKDSGKGKRADLSGSNLSGSNLSYSDLSGSNLSNSNLSNSNLSNSNLRGSNLRGSNLRGSDLSNSDLDKRYICISCIGSRNDQTSYCFDDDIVWCGCWKGSLKEFEAKVKETYPDEKNLHHRQYIGWIRYVESLK